MSEGQPLYKNYRNAGAALRHFDDRNTQSKTLLKAYLGDWLPKVNAKVLDIGCGKGDLLANLRDWGFLKLRGVDLSPSQVEVARARGLNVHLGDACDFLRNVGEKYDVVFLMDVIEHIPRSEVIGFLEAIGRSLNAGGVVIGQTPNGDSREVGAILWDDATHMWCYTPGGVRQCFDAAGNWEVESRESVVPPYRLTWSIRWLYWQVKRRLIAFDRRLEHGGVGSGIYSRVFRFRARKC